MLGYQFICIFITSANIKIEDLFHYSESKEKFATEKNLKRANFREAIEQIQAALAGDDSAPIDVNNLNEIAGI